MQYPTPVKGWLALLNAAMLLMPAVVLAGMPGPFADDQKDRPKRGQTQRRGGDASLTGCVDQVEGQYMLVEQQSLKRLAALRAETFEQEGFAKHLGQKVTVQGRLSSEEGRPVMRVRSVKTVSEVCSAPQGAR